MAAYKADFILFMAINTAFFYVSLALWLTIYRTTGQTEISSYTLSNTVTYYLLTTLIYRFDIAGTIYLGEEIWNGSFTNDLIKPFNMAFIHFLAALSDTAIGLLSFLPFLLIMSLSSIDYISLPTPTNLLMFILTISLAMIMNFFFNMILHALTFHFGDRQSLIELVSHISSFLAGGVFPLAFLSGWTEKAFLALPFKYLFSVPIEVFLGKMDLSQILSAWMGIGLWTILFYVIFRWVYNTGLKKYSGTGQ